jgi:hypothetical protein
MWVRIPLQAWFTSFSAFFHPICDKPIMHIGESCKMNKDSKSELVTTKWILKEHSIDVDRIKLAKK